GIDADIWCVIDAAHREREFIIDRKLLLRKEFYGEICLDSSMVAAGHRFASFFFIGERTRLNFSCHAAQHNRSRRISNAVSETSQPVCECTASRSALMDRLS